MRRLFVRLPALLLLLAGANAVWAFSSGPPASRTNALGLGIYPPEANCTQCHSGNALNDPNGKVEILGVPFRYEPGHSYPLRVRTSYSLADTTGASNPKWGFELTAVNAADGLGAGTLIAPNPGPGPAFTDSLLIKTATTAPFSTSGRQYIEHSTFSTRTDLPSPAEWQFTWIAPSSTPPTRIYFYAAGNAANGNGSSGGDHIFTGSDSTDVINPLPAAPPWVVVALLVVLAGSGLVIVRRRTA